MTLASTALYVNPQSQRPFLWNRSGLVEADVQRGNGRNCAALSRSVRRSGVLGVSSK